ncbi:MAG: hypothetical protein AAF933_15155 [Pseudomonadota bacterium]
MTTALASCLAVLSAALTHSSVRGAPGRRRALVFSAALLALAAALSIAAKSGGFWTGAYTMLAVYILSCSLSPWVLMLWKRRDAG